MPASQRGDVSWPFLVLAVVIAGVVAVGYVRYPETLRLDRRLVVAYGTLLVSFSLAYGYRPIRESRLGPLLSAAFLMLFAVFHYRQGGRGPLLPYGLFAVALAAFCYELYKIGTARTRRGQAS